ncbi:MAG: 50S ribosomal protein L30 [Gammaproteobacteria bacterium]|mgnify:FL=1|jgi:large subunit ribosomal protein L30|nr:50S ribosomal protein L30 [Gammaproteobacteria bacterium]|tara:strand:- start:651 stop:833 length:183 start_codon:yes stop_codon:yes gene_type:complete
MAKIKVTQTKSLIGRKKNHRLSVKGLGLRRIGDSKILEDTPSVRGMVSQVDYLLNVEEVK